MRVLELDKYQGIVVCGQRGWGKSGCLEFLGEQFVKTNRLTLDLFDSGDFESAFWCVPKEKSYPILLVHPNYCALDLSRCNYDIKVTNDEVGLQAICEQAINEKRIVVFGCGFYEEEHKYKVLADWFNEFPRLNRDILNTDAIILIREASDVVFSHLKIAENSSLTRKALLRFLRIARHFRTSFIFDCQRIMAIYSGIRHNLDKIIVKRIPKHAIPDLLQWVVKDIDEKYELIRPNRFPQIPFLRKNEFYCVTESSYFYGKNPMPSFLHKEPTHNFLEMANIKVTYDEIPQEHILNKRETKELEYLRRAVGFFADKIYQRKVEVDGLVFSLRKWAKQVDIDVGTIAKYANQK